jgi:tetratricopeptide (TPR) repeat protein
MPGAAPAIDELRRRVEKDPTSIAFAHLAEELRRVGRYDEAVHVCRAGLERHPTYLSARMTLGRTLLALQQYEEARTEIEYVLRAAPDNLLALKCMNELQGLDGNTAAPAPEPAEPNLRIQSVPEPAKPDLRVQTSPEPPKVEPPVVAAVASPKPHPSTSARGALSGVEGQSGDGGPVAAPEPARVEPPVIAAPAPEVTALVEASSNGGPPAEHPAVAALEDWQARIQADRARRSGGSGPHPSTSARGALSDAEGQDRPR